MAGFRRFTNGITFNVSEETRDEIDRISLEQRKTVSEILRSMIEDHLSKESKTKTAPEEVTHEIKY